MSINRVVLTGRLTKDVDLKATTSGQNVVSFSIAVDSFQKDQDNNKIAYFINCVAWEKQAQYLGQYCKKGNLLAVEGRLQTRSYDGKSGKVYVTEVVCDRVENLTPKDSSQSQPASDNNGFSINNNDDDNQSLSYSDEDLPF